MPFVSFDDQPAAAGFVDFDAPVAPKADQGDLSRGFKESFQQLPQMGYGAMAGIGAAAETAFGEGGIATGIKKAGIKGYEEAGAKIAQNAKPSDSWNHSYDQAKEGNFGALVDWLQHGIGYVGGQAVQTLLTGGLGAVGGKFVASTAAKQIAEGMVAKEVATLAATDAGKALAADQLTKMATAKVALKFATLGQGVAVAASAVGMEGGEIFGDLTATNKDRALTGSEIGKAFAATLGTGALEFVGDKVGLDIMLGKSKLLKPTEAMSGMSGRLARGAVAAVGAAPIEAGTEYAQTLAEEYGKGNDPLSEASLAQARDAAALGALGGTTVGGVGGALHGAKAVAPPPASTPAGPTLQLGNTPDPMIAFPDGTVARRSEVDAHIASLPADQQVAAKAWAMGMGERAAKVDPVQTVMATNSVDDAIAAANAAVETDNTDFADLMQSERRNLQVMQAQLDQDRIKQGQLEQVHSQSIETMGRLPDQQVAAASAATDETPTAMQLAMQRAQQKVAGAVVEPSLPGTVAAAVPQDQRLVPKSKRNVQDQAPRTNPEATQAAPVEAPANSRIDAAGQPAARTEAGASPLATTGVKPVDQRLVPVSKRTTQNEPLAPANTEQEATETVATDAGPIGRNNVPMAEGGKPYRNKRDADSARKNQPAMRVKRVDGGYALVEKSPSQLAAQEKAAKRLSQPRTSPNGEPIPAHSMVAAAGALNKQTMSDMGLGDNPKVGNRRLFAASGGLTIEQATERMVEEGYLPEGASHSQAMDLIKRSLTNPQYTPEGTERIAAQEIERRQAAEQSEAEAVAELESADDNVFDINDDDIPWDAPVSNTSTEDAMRALGFTDQEISDAIANEPGRESQGGKSGGRPDEGATSQAPADVGRRESASREDQGDRAEGLTSPTREDVLAQQDRAEAATKAAAKADTDAANKNKADAERGEFTLTGSDRAADVGAAGGQTDIFSDAVSETKATLKANGITGKEQLDIIKDVKAGTLTADEVKEAYPAKATITDFGQKIGGAKKDTWTGFKDDLGAVSDDEIAGRKLSEIWPSPDYQKMVDDGMDAKSVAVIRALRDEIPAKPRAPYKLKRWAEQVKTMRELATNILNGKDTGSAVVAQLERGSSQMRGIAGRVDLYQAVGHGKSLEGIRLSLHHYSLYRGRENVTLWVAERDAGATAFSNWPQELAIGDTKEDAIAAFKARYAELDGIAAVKKASFDIYSQDGKFFIGKKIGRNIAEMAGPFDTLKETREYRSANLPALDAKLAKYKEIPQERRDTNEPRVGEDMRNGQDVTPEMFGQAFGFKGVEFGNWVEQKRRQKDLNDAFDALMDMAAIMGVPAKAISLNGELGLAFGARGSGGVNPAAAHYESDKIVINLTKREGAGSLGHEWWHALDNYFSRMRGNKTSPYMTTATDVGLSARGSQYVAYPGVRKEMIDAFGEVVRSIKQTALKARSSKMDAKRTKEYWTTGEEMSARAFESYLISKLQDQNASNDYLANVVDQKTWDAMAALGMENEDSYPYPTAGEMPTIRAGFDKFFQTLETKETDKGVAMYARQQVPEAMRRSFTMARGLPVSEVQRMIDRLTAKQESGPDVRVVATAKELPVPAPRDARGMVHGDTIYIVASNHQSENGIAKTFGHEVVGHFGLWRMLGEDGQRQFEKNMQLALKAGNKSLKAISETVRSMYVDENGKFNLTPEEEAHEIAAFAVERAIDQKTGEFNPGFGFLKSVFAKVAEFLRSMGVKIKFTNIELQGMLVNSMRGLEAGHRLEGGGQTMVAAALGGRDLPDVSNQRTGISTALLHLGQNEDLFQYPRSYSLDPKDIADDKATPDFGRIEVSDVDKDTDNNKLWMLSNTTPDDNQAEGVKSWILTTPGGKHATLTKKGKEVYINVSGIGEGNGGSAIYDLAANYALNNGLVFVGDPNGVSNVAMRRRLENMLSSAIKYGTTDHLQPHADQYLGNADIGVPPLDWTKGDTLGNIRHMVDVSIEANEYANPSTTRQIDFRPDTQTFVRGDGSLVGNEDLSDLLGFEGRSQGSGGGGNTTLRRYALFKSLLQSVGNRTKFLEQLYHQQDGGSENPSGALKKSFYARGGIVGQTTRQHTPEQLRAMKNVGFDVEAPTLKERAQALWKDAGKKLAQGIADQFAPVKDLDQNAYAMLRLAKGASGAFEAFLQGGKLKLTDGVYDFDDTNKGGVIDKLLIPLQGEHHDFMRWVAANRAERLAGEGKENLFSAQDIADLKTLASGTTDFDYTVQTGPAKGRVTRDRTLIYADANRVFSEFNRNVLDMAEQSGLIDGASRKVWEHEFYVPFYRVADEDGGGVRGMSVKGSVLRQQAFKELKGGKNALNADLLDNTLMNWAHLLDAAAKNRAAKATIEAAERLGLATGGNQSTLASMGTSINNKNGVVWFMDGGQKRFSLIDNTGEGPYLMTALNALEYAGMRNPVMNAMGAMKHALTVGVTASPFFKIRNLIRDSVQAIGTGNLGYNPAANIAQGWKLTDPKSDAYFRLLAGGGTIHFGTMLEGSEAKRVQALVESGVDDATILNSDNKVKAFYRKFIEPGVSAYNELGNRGEAVNRAALYDQLVKQGMSHAEASLQARDLMDFSMQGSFTSVRFLTQVVPFLNARIQGLYKLGKSAKEDPARFGAVLGAVTMASLGLLAAYGDDDDWKKREEWDRNNFWWFKFGGQAFRIPKPFEIGAIATLAERGFELAFDKEMTNKRFMSQVMTLLGDNLSMNPVPQLVKPMLDVYANKDSFSGRPIETMGMDKLKADYRFTDRTSMTARAISTGMNAVTELAGKESLSPVQVDSMLRGYFGWLGSFVIGAADVLARPATGQAEHPSSDIWKAATGGMASDLRDAPSRYVSQMYEQAKELEQAYGTWRALQKEGKTLEAAEFYEANKADLSKYKNVEAVKRAEAKFNERIRMIERSNMAADEKRKLIRSIQVQKNRVAQLVT